MSFIKVECMSGCGLTALSGLPSGDLVNRRADPRPHLTLFPASSQICPPVEMQAFDPVCFCNLCFFFQSDCYAMVFLFHVTELFSPSVRVGRPRQSSHNTVGI